jgi:hypothetical protein
MRAADVFTRCAMRTKFFGGTPRAPSVFPNQRAVRASKLFVGAQCAPSMSLHGARCALSSLEERHALLRPSRTSALCALPTVCRRAMRAADVFTPCAMRTKFFGGAPRAPSIFMNRRAVRASKLFVGAQCAPPMSVHSALCAPSSLEERHVLLQSSRISALCALPHSL